MADKPNAAQHGMMALVLGVKNGSIKPANVREGIRKKVVALAAEITPEAAKAYGKPVPTPPRTGFSQVKTRFARG